MKLLIISLMLSAMACGTGESVLTDTPDANNDASFVCPDNCQLNPDGDACTCFVDAAVVKDAAQDNEVKSDSACSHDASKCDDDDDCNDDLNHLQWHGPF